MIKAGVAYYSDEDSYLCGVRVLENAIKNGNIKNPDLTLAFCDNGLDPKLFFSGLRSALGEESMIVGGSAVGVLTNQNLSYQGHSSGVAVLELDGVQARISSVGDLERDERHAGRKLGSLLQYQVDDQLLLIFYHSVKTESKGNRPAVLISSTQIIDGIDQVLQSKIPIFGAGLISDFEIKDPITQFCGLSAESGSVVGTMLSGKFNTYHSVMTGCGPLDGVYRRITKKEGATIYELDNKPIVSTLDTLYGNQEWRKQQPLRYLNLGVNHGEKFGEPKEGDYVNRLITGALADGSGVSIFEPDLEEGDEVQFMIRDSSKMLESARTNSEQLIARIKADGKTPRFGLYIDCAGRVANILDVIDEEAIEVQKVFNRHGIPLLGFFSGVEIAPIMGKSKGLDWTGVLIVLAGDE